MRSVREGRTVKEWGARMVEGGRWSRVVSVKGGGGQGGGGQDNAGRGLNPRPERSTPVKYPPVIPNPKRHSPEMNQLLSVCCSSALAWVDRSGRGFNPRPASGRGCNPRPARFRAALGMINIFSEIGIRRYNTMQPTHSHPLPPTPTHTHPSTHPTHPTSNHYPELSVFCGGCNR